MKCRALVIGVNNYQDPEIRNLECAVADAKALADVLPDFGFETCLLENPTADGVETALSKMLSGLSAGDVFLFSFSGHGFAAEGGQDLLFCADDMLGRLRYRRAGLPFEMIREDTEVSSCHRVFLLDACRSDFQVGMKGSCGATKDLTPLSAMAVTEDDLSSIAVMRSCKAFQCSREIASEGHGLFTQALLDVLQGMRQNGERIAFDFGLMKRIAKRMRTIVKMCGICMDQEPEFQNSGLATVALNPSEGRVEVISSDVSDADVPDYPGRNDARRNSDREIIVLANNHIKSGEYAEAYALLQTVGGNCEVQTTLGLMHLQGLGCKRQSDVGIKLLQDASLAGSSRADFNLYYHFADNGRRAEALPYLVKAADRDDVDALFVLADEYRRSGEVVKMEHCLMRGARLGDGRAVRLLKNQKERMGI